MLNLKGEDLKSKFNLSKFIYIALMVSVFIYAMVVNVIKTNNTFTAIPMPDENYSIFKYILYGISFAMFFIIRHIRGLLLSNKSNQGNAGLNNHPARFFSLTIVTAALCESVAIYGLVLFFVSQQTADFYTLMAISLLYFIYYFPKYQQWEGWVKEYPMEKLS